jgi:hypothetical protein
MGICHGVDAWIGTDVNANHAGKPLPVQTPTAPNIQGQGIISMAADGMVDDVLANLLV